MLAQVGVALVGREGERALEQGGQPFPSIAWRWWPGPRHWIRVFIGLPPFNCTPNQARASSQWRFTVAAETSSAAAVSSIVIPANTRHSTTRAAPAWTVSRRVSASLHGQQIIETIVGDDPVEIEFDGDGAGAALVRVARGRVIDQHAAHRPGGGGKEVRAVPPLDARQADQPRVGLVRQRRRGQRVSAPLAGQLLPRDAAQRVVDDRHQRIQRLAPIDVRTAEERRDVPVAVALVRWRRR